MNAVNSVVSHMLRHQEEAGHVLALRSAPFLRYFADPYRFQCGSGSSIVGQCGSDSGSRVLVTENWSKFTAEKLKITYSLLTSPLKLDFQATVEAFSPQRKHPALKTWNFFTFFYFFVGHFCPPGSGSAFPVRIRIRIQLSKINADPDPHDCIILSWWEQILY